MKVLDLGCAQSHVFEGWFASEEDFQSQLARGLLECPMCGDRHIEKRLSAPRLNLRAQDSAAPIETATPPTATPAASSDLPPDMQALMLRAMREVMAKSEDVGERFADEARRMHYGEIEQRSIRGRTTLADATALVDEGIDVLPMPDLDVLKQTLQ